MGVPGAGGEVTTVNGLKHNDRREREKRGTKTVEVNSVKYSIDS